MLRAVGGIACGAWLPPSFHIWIRPPSTTVFGADLLLRNAHVFDGTGAPPREVDVAITGDRISAVRPSLSAPEARAIDLAGLALAPGFIDIHSHTDLELLVDRHAQSKVRQGVTTEVTGQDGSSIGPWRPPRAREIAERYRIDFGVDIEFHDLAGFYRRLERDPPAVNLTSMIGHGTIRDFVIGAEDRAPTTVELTEMKQLVADAVTEGACGLSSGLEYVPGAFADLEELVAVTGVLRGTDLPYATHVRNEDDELFAAVEEALDVGGRAGVAVHISHLKAQGQPNWWKAEPVLDLLTAASASGVDATFDRYPYVAYATGLSSLFPIWTREGGTDAFLARLRDPMLASRIEADVRAKIDRLGTWEAVQVTATSSPELTWAVGRRLGSLARERGINPYALLVDIITRDRNRTGMVGFGMSEINTARFLAHPLGMICSDGSALPASGPLARGTPHPRSFGTYPHVLGHYCREKGVTTLDTAIHKMTAMPARRLNLVGRGIITEGAFADLVAFDPNTVAGRATFEQPHQYPIGIPLVMVNGRFVIRDGEHTGEMPGRVLRPGK